MDVSNCLFDRAEETGLVEFIHKYEKSFPMLVMVTGGYDGATEFDDTPSDTVSYKHRPPVGCVWLNFKQILTVM